MILQALCEYYERKVADPESQMAPEGFEWKEIPFLIVLDKNGMFIRFNDTREGEGKKRVGKRFLLPQGEKKASGIKANLLWDGLEYVLGANPRDRSDVAQRHSAFVRRMHETFDGYMDRFPVPALLGFMDSQPLDKVLSIYTDTSIWKEILDLNSNLTFWIDGEVDGLASNHIKDICIATNDNAISEQKYCMVTGNKTPITRIHPSIKGVWGGQPSGGALISFQVHSGYDSFGKEQNYNAPIGEYATFAYTTALNFLLRKESMNRMQIGDASTVFWSQKGGSSFEKNLKSFFAFPPKDKDDPDKGAPDARQSLTAILTGIPPEELSSKFYILGLSPNAARISVRFWHEGYVSDFAKNMKQHLDDLDIIASKYDQQRMGLMYLLSSTVFEGKSENIPPNLVGNIMRAVLANNPYPETFQKQCLRRIRAEHDVGRARAAILKSCINRKLRRINPDKYEKECIKMSLDITNVNPGYRLGRLFAVLEKIQEDASPGLNATIRDRFYGSASSNPVVVFPRLIGLSNHHLSKLKSDKPGYAVNDEKWLSEIMSGIKGSFPSHMMMDDQAKFAIGYYHQKQAFYVTTKDQSTNSEGEGK